MSQRVDGAHESSQEVVSRTPRWLPVVAIFAVGVWVGAVGFGGGGTEESPGSAVDGAAAVGCGGDLTLIVDADGLEEGAYELRASVGDRMLPMINSMTYPLIGMHRDHQLVVPDGGRLLIVANVPVGEGSALRYELVGDGSKAAVSGALQPEACTGETPTPEPVPTESTSMAEFFIESDSGDYIFERVDRSSPEPLEASEGQACFTDSEWTYNGAPYARGDSVTSLPSGAQRGEVNVLRQCDTASHN